MFWSFFKFPKLVQLKETLSNAIYFAQNKSFFMKTIVYNVKKSEKRKSIQSTWQNKVSLIFYSLRSFNQRARMNEKYGRVQKIFKAKAFFNWLKKPFSNWEKLKRRRRALQFLFCLIDNLFISGWVKLVRNFIQNFVFVILTENYSAAVKTDQNFKDYFEETFKSTIILVD